MLAGRARRLTVEVSLRATGSGDALGLFKLQGLDYVISGAPYTDNELAGLDLIRAPITVTAGVPLVTVPRKTGTSAGWQSTITVDHIGSEGPPWDHCLNDARSQLPRFRITQDRYRILNAGGECKSEHRFHLQWAAVVVWLVLPAQQLFASCLI